MKNSTIRDGLLCAAVLIAAVGCRSPYYADQGALFGGVTGAGVGAVVGNAVGNTAAGTVLGAGVGALTGAAVGQSLDEIDARNRADIAARMGREVPAGAVTIPDVVAMNRAGVEEELIVNHVRTSGMAAPLNSQDLIYLKEQGVSARVVQTMQTAPRPTPRRVDNQPVVIREQYYYDPYYGGPYWGHRHRYHCDPSPHVSWGVSFGHH